MHDMNFETPKLIFAFIVMVSFLFAVKLITGMTWWIVGLPTLCVLAIPIWSAAMLLLSGALALLSAVPSIFRTDT